MDFFNHSLNYEQNTLCTIRLDKYCCTNIAVLSSHAEFLSRWFKVTSMRQTLLTAVTSRSKLIQHSKSLDIACWNDFFQDVIDKLRLLHFFVPL